MILFACSWLTLEVLLPGVAAAALSKRFITQVYKCDSAMDNDWYNRQNSPTHAKSDSIQLLDCHDYDKTRKLMLMAGLPESYLSWLGLKSLEIHQQSAVKLAEKHRFSVR